MRGNGRGAHGEDVHLAAELLEALLLGDAEPLLVVDDHEAEVLEGDVLLDEAVGADDDVDRAGAETLGDLALLKVGAEAAQDLHLHGEGAEALGESGVVLLGQDGGGTEHRGLLAVLDRLEGRSNRHLGLAVADVAADQAIEGVGELHARLHLGDGLKLVGGLHEGEGLLHLPLPCAVGGEGVAGEHLSGCVEGQQLVGHLAGGAAGAVPGAAPLLAAEAGEGRGRLAGGEVGADAVEEVAGDVEAVAAGVLEGEVLLLAVLGGDAAGADEARNTVVDVDDVGAGLKLRKEGLAAEGLAAERPAPLGAAKHLAVGEEDEGARAEGQGEALEGGGGDEGDGAGLGGRVHAGGDASADVLLAEDFAEALRVVGQHDDAFAVAGAAACALGKGVEAAPVSRRGRDARLATVGRRAEGLEVEAAGAGFERVVDSGPGPQRRGEAGGKLAALLLAAPLGGDALLHLLARLADAQRLVEGDDTARPGGSRGGRPL